MNRLQDLQELNDLGYEVYPAEGYNVSNSVISLNDNITSTIKIAGRLVSMRDMGKSAFAHIRDESGDIQIYFKLNNFENPEIYKRIIQHILQLGDIIGVEGKLFRTRTGELTLEVLNFNVLSLTHHVIPFEKRHGDEVKMESLTDLELQYRHRYVDLIVHPEKRQLFKNRTKIIQSIRNSLNIDGFMEVDTPTLQVVHGGASARPFTTHHNALDMDLYLRIANELYLKRLIVGGFEKIFEFSRNFRNEGISPFHNPEFTALELYVAYWDYEKMMKYCENMIKLVCHEVNHNFELTFKDHTVNLLTDFKTLDFCESILAKSNINILESSNDEMYNLLRSNGTSLENNSTSYLMDKMFSYFVEPDLIGPTFVINYPVELSPLARKHRNNDRLTERFELFMFGKEIANGYTELADPIDQRERLVSQLNEANQGNEEAMLLDEDFLFALEHGMPPTAGLGIGIDRLCMMILNQPSIKDIILFPLMKPQQ